MMTDEQLVQGCIGMSRQAQKLLFEKFSRKMMGVCVRYAESRDEAEDHLQEGFIKVFEKIESFRSSGSLEGWIKKIMVNTCLDHIRRNKSLGHMVDITDQEYLLTNNETVLDVVSANDLMKMMEQMPAGFRAVFNMFAVEGYSHKEIAEQLGVSESTSKSQYMRARIFMQKLILQTEKIF